MLDTRPILLPQQFRLWKWMASYYLCTMGDVYKAALPSGMKLESETIVTANPDYEATTPLTPREQQVLDLLTQDPEQCITQLEKRLNVTRNILPVINNLLAKRSYQREGRTQTQLQAQDGNTREALPGLPDRRAFAPALRRTGTRTEKIGIADEIPRTVGLLHGQSLAARSEQERVAHAGGCHPNDIQRIGGERHIRDLPIRSGTA